MTERSRIVERWLTVADWLGRHKPLDLILGAVTIIAAVSLLGQAI